METKVDLSLYHNALSRRHQALRLLWQATWTLGTWCLPRNTAMPWKRFLLRLFGAHIHATANVYRSARVYYPPHLTMEAHTCLASDVDCYNVAPVVIKANTTVSQGAMLCTASHDIQSPRHTLLCAPIVLEDQVWVGARAFIGMGVTIHQGAVVGATASVYRSVQPWTVVGGNPARTIKKRTITDLQ